MTVDSLGKDGGGGGHVDVGSTAATGGRSKIVPGSQSLKGSRSEENFAPAFDSTKKSHALRPSCKLPHVQASGSHKPCLYPVQTCTSGSIESDGSFAGRSSPRGLELMGGVPFKKHVDTKPSSDHHDCTSWQSCIGFKRSDRKSNLTRACHRKSISSKQSRIDRNENFSLETPVAVDNMNNDTTSIKPGDDGDQTANTQQPRLVQRSQFLTTARNNFVALIASSLLWLSVVGLHQLSHRFNLHGKLPDGKEDEPALSLFGWLFLFCSTASSLFKTRDRAGDRLQCYCVIAGALSAIAHAHLQQTDVPDSILKILPPYIGSVLVFSWIFHAVARSFGTWPHRRKSELKDLECAEEKVGSRQLTPLEQA